MTPRPNRAADAGPEIAVVDSRPLFGRAMAAVFESAGVPVVVLAPEAVGRLIGSVRVALVALVVADLPGVVGELSRLGCRVIVYGAVEHPSLGVAARAGAVGFVSEGGGAIDFEQAVDAAVRGTPRLPRDSTGDRFDQQGFGELTRREREVLDGLVAGLRPADIARRDFVSVVTVRNQVQSVLTKLNVHSQLEAVAAVRWLGWSPVVRDSGDAVAFDASAS